MQFIHVPSFPFFVSAVKRSCVREMMRQPIRKESGVRGRIINIASQHGMVACPGDLAYGIGI